MSDNELRKTLRLGWDDALRAIPEALKTEGFGVLTEIDVKETLEKKLDVEFRRYKILGACNPPLAKQALDTELEIGRFLPCNVIVYENDEGKVVVSAIDPRATIASLGIAALVPLAEQVREKLARVVSRLG